MSCIATPGRIGHRRSAVTRPRPHVLHLLHEVLDRKPGDHRVLGSAAPVGQVAESARHHHRPPSVHRRSAERAGASPGFQSATSNRSRVRPTVNFARLVGTVRDDARVGAGRRRHRRRAEHRKRPGGNLERGARVGGLRAQRRRRERQTATEQPAPREQRRSSEGHRGAEWEGVARGEHRARASRRAIALSDASSTTATSKPHASRLLCPPLAAPTVCRSAYTALPRATSALD